MTKTCIIVIGWSFSRKKNLGPLKNKLFSEVKFSLFVMDGLALPEGAMPPLAPLDIRFLITFVVVQVQS